MRAPALFLALLSLAAPLRAVEPIVELELSAEETVPGQSLSLRVTVLVPTWMPEPVDFPSFEIPNLRVRLPDRATNPTSRSVDGESWPGVVRRIELSPMVPGRFAIPPQELRITFADPDNPPTPIREVVRTEAIIFRGLVPEGAEGLDPFIAATSLSLSQELEGETLDMQAGDSAKWTLTAHIEGTSPIVLPQLLPPLEIEGIASYPDAPVVDEEAGTRSESLTLMAEGGGAGELPAIELRWYDLDTQTVQTASVEGFSVSVVGPVAADPSTTARPRPWSWFASMLFGALFLALGTRRVRDRYLRRRERRRQSADFAFGKILEAVRAHDYAPTRTCLDLWANRLSSKDPRDDESIRHALLQLGHDRFGASPRETDAKIWKELERALRAAKRAAKHPAGQDVSTLPPLNPVYESSR